MAKSPKRPITLVPPPEDPVKRRLLKKTDMRNDESVMNVDENLLNVVSILTKDENIPEANSNEDNEMPKFTVLYDYEEMMKGRQKELNSLKEMGTMTVVKRTEAVGKRTIQTRWVDREKMESGEMFGGCPCHSSFASFHPRSIQWLRHRRDTSWHIQQFHMRQTGHDGVPEFNADVNAGAIQRADPGSLWDIIIQVEPIIQIVT